MLYLMIEGHGSKKLLEQVIDSGHLQPNLYRDTNGIAELAQYMALQVIVGTA